MGSWVILKVEVNAAEQPHVNTQVGYCIEALKSLGFVETVFDSDYEIEEERT